MQCFQHLTSRVISVPRDGNQCPRGKKSICGQDSCIDVEVNKETQLSVLQDFLASSRIEDAFGDFQQGEGECRICTTFMGHGILQSKNILRTRGSKYVSWELQGWLTGSLVSLAKNLTRRWQ